MSFPQLRSPRILYIHEETPAGITTTQTIFGKARVTAQSELAQVRASQAKRAEPIASDTSPPDRDRRAVTPVQLADKEKPFVLIHAGGAKREEYKHFTGRELGGRRAVRGVWGRVGSELRWEVAA